MPVTYITYKTNMTWFLYVCASYFRTSTMEAKCTRGYHDILGKALAGKSIEDPVTDR